MGAPGRGSGGAASDDSLGAGNVRSIVRWRFSFFYSQLSFLRPEFVSVAISILNA
jgi:hypothetical protein